MKNNKAKRSILILYAIVIFLSSCTSKVINTENTDMFEQSDIMLYDDGSEEISPVSQITSKYEKIRFGETQDILLLDVEWHTAETYLAEVVEPQIIDEGYYYEWHNAFMQLDWDKFHDYMI